MSNLPIVRRTIISNNFLGDNYLSKKEFLTLTEKPKPEEKNSIQPSKKLNVKHKIEKSNGCISSEEYRLNSIFEYWIKDNLYELRNIFSNMVNIYNKHSAFLNEPPEKVFKNFIRMIFYNNLRNISLEYESL